MLEIKVDNNTYHVRNSITLKEIIEKIPLENKEIIVAAIVNNKIHELYDKVEEDSVIKFLDISSVMGNRIYRRSLFLLLSKAVCQIFPGSLLTIEHSLSNGMYCELKMNTNILNEQHIRELNSYMKELVKKKLPITRQRFNKEKVLSIYKKQGCYDRVDIIKNVDYDEFTLYELDGYYDYFFYHMVPGTEYLDKFSLKYSYPGFILLFPQKDDPYHVPKFKEQPKLARIFMEYEKIGEMMKVSTVAGLNSYISRGKHHKLMTISEALHEKNIAQIADEISKNISKRKIVLIAGPSSSGKTTFTRKLSTFLQINGLKPVTISTDDYFVNREDTPCHKNGEYNFEALEAIDLELFNSHLIELMQNRKIKMPRFNFQTGRREYTGEYLQLKENQPLLIEGIHSLNDRLTRVIPADYKFKIYVSALTQLNIDRHNRIPTTDTRLIRRIVRDHHFRGHSAKKTLQLWPSVRSGEKKNIFPYQENADIMFNSALLYEISVLKEFATPLLEQITGDVDVYYEAERLLEIFSYFNSISEKEVPNTSILREFIGGSIFKM